MDGNIKDKSIRTSNRPTDKLIIIYECSKFLKRFDINYNRGKGKAKNRSERWF